MRLISSTLRSALLLWGLNSTRELLRLCVAHYHFCSPPSDNFLKHRQTTAITLTLLVRSIGAVSTFFPLSKPLLRCWSYVSLDLVFRLRLQFRCHFGDITLISHHMTGFLRCPFRSLRTQVATGGESPPVLCRPTWHQLRPDLRAVPRREIPFRYSDGRGVGSSVLHRARKSPRRSTRARIGRAPTGIRSRVPHLCHTESVPRPEDSPWLARALLDNIVHFRIRSLHSRARTGK